MTESRLPLDSPLYYRLAATLRDRIEAGELEPRVPVPSERMLSEEFGVSRMTARMAIQLLEAEGYVYRNGRRGTFVAEPRLELPIGSFSADVARAGRLPGARVLRTETAPPSEHVRAALALPPGAEVHVLQRLRFAGGEPLALENTYLPAASTPDLLKQDLEHSIWQLLAQRYDVQVVRAEAVVEAVELDRFEARALHTRQRAAAILLTRTAFDPDDRPVEFARDIYRGDRASFRVGANVSLETLTRE